VALADKSEIMSIPHGRNWSGPYADSRPPEQGRVYAMGRMRANFKADCDESAGRYSASEWGLEASTRGPEGHAHPEDQAFNVIAGTFNDELT
jgi:hypothetical protein